MSCKSILVVEDDQDIRESVRQLLEMEGFAVRTAGNGREAMEILSKVDSPCLILLDLMMPVMNGWQFLEARNRDAVIANIPVVISSAAGDFRVPKGVEYMPKPVDVEALIHLVESHCKHLDRHRRPQTHQSAA